MLVFRCSMHALDALCVCKCVQSTWQHPAAVMIAARSGQSCAPHALIPASKHVQQCSDVLHMCTCSTLHRQIMLHAPCPCTSADTTLWPWALINWAMLLSRGGASAQFHPIASQPASLASQPVQPVSSVDVNGGTWVHTDLACDNCCICVQPVAKQPALAHLGSGSWHNQIAAGASQSTMCAHLLGRHTQKLKLHSYMKLKLDTAILPTVYMLSPRHHEESCMCKSACMHINAKQDAMHATHHKLVPVQAQRIVQGPNL